MDTKSSYSRETKQYSWIEKHYGSRRGFLRTYWYAILYYIGKYNHLKQVEWHAIERLVFICKGNICRSAYAEAIARSIGINTISCGLDTIEDAPANTSAQYAAKKRGVTLTEHKTKPIMYQILRKSDLIIVMEPWQAGFIKQHLMRGYRCTLLGLWGHPVLPHIQDPYGASPKYFDVCFEYIENCVHEIAEKIKK